MDDFFGPSVGDSIVSGLTQGLGTVLGAAGVKYLGLQPSQPGSSSSPPRAPAPSSGMSTGTLIAIAVGVGVLVIVLVLVLKK